MPFVIHSEREKKSQQLFRKLYTKTPSEVIRIKSLEILPTGNVDYSVHHYENFSPHLQVNDFHIDSE